MRTSAWLGVLVLANAVGFVALWLAVSVPPPAQDWLWGVFLVVLAVDVAAHLVVRYRAGRGLWRWLRSG